MLTFQTVLVTGCAGFIGSFLCKKLLTENETIKIIGIDNMNAYYDVLKKSLSIISQNGFLQ